jgi:hypothetical protein
MSGRWVEVDDLMQQGYAYRRVARAGRDFHADFRPQLTPPQMLSLGVFGGKYMTDCGREFPRAWFDQARLCPQRHDAALNCFGVNASQPLSVWRQRGWIHEDDPRGWFQWYCRYFMGRRGADDARQIARWRAIRRHIAQLQRNCARFDFGCRRRQRQAILHWAYDAREM